MPYPTPPTNLYSFTGFQTGSPTTPLPADQIDAQYADHKASLDEIISFLQVQFAAAGVLQSGTVTDDMLATNPATVLADAVAARDAAISAQTGAVAAKVAAEQARDQAEAIAGYEEAPIDGNAYVRTDGDWALLSAFNNPDWADIQNKPATFAPSAHTHTIGEVTSLQTTLDGKLNLTGGTLTGDLVLPGNPDANLKAAPKQYVDTGLATKANTSHSHVIADVTSLQTTLDAKLAKTGGVMTGKITLDGDPTADLHAVPRQFAVSRVGPTLLAVESVAWGASPVIDMSTQSVKELTSTATVATASLSNVAANQQVEIRITCASASASLAWTGVSKWAGGAAPVLSQNVGDVDAIVLSVQSDGVTVLGEHVAVYS